MVARAEIRDMPFNPPSFHTPIKVKRFNLPAIVQAF